MPDNKLTTAAVLAAGMGNRLKPLTDNLPKCMVEVAGKPLLAHIMDALEKGGFKRLVIVTGYKADMLNKFVKGYETSLKVELIHNESYDVTNNIYSLWLASENLRNGFALVESDIVLEPHVLEEFSAPDKIALDVYDKSKHNGTTASVNENGFVENLILKQEYHHQPAKYKTVNIYSFSKTTGKKLLLQIEHLIKKGYLNSFYEVAIKNLLDKNEISLEMIDFENIWWDEIDTPEDLERVNEVLLKNGSAILQSAPENSL